MTKKLELTIISGNGDLSCMIYAKGSTTIGGIKSMIQEQLKIPAASQVLLIPSHNEIISTDNTKTLSMLGITDNELISIVSTPEEDEDMTGDTASATGNVLADMFRSRTAPAQTGVSWEVYKGRLVKQLDSEVENKRIDNYIEEIITNKTNAVTSGHNFKSTFGVINPELCDAAIAEDRVEMKKIIRNQQIEILKKQYDEQMKLIEASKNPNSQEAQEVLLQNARKNFLDEQSGLRKQLNPETEEQIDMLYVPMEIKDIVKDSFMKIIAFVDTGCSTSIMSLDMCREAGLEQLIDKRDKNIAVGIGVQKIYGKVHSLPARVGNQEFFFSCLIMEKCPKFMFGLDLLKAHNGILDLAKGHMEIMGQKINFLTKNELIEAGLGRPAKEAPPQAKKQQLQTNLGNGSGAGGRTVLEARIAKMKEKREAAIAIVMSETGATFEVAKQHLIDSKWDPTLATGLILSMSEMKKE